jgi:hypothetical protein
LNKYTLQVMEKRLLTTMPLIIGQITSVSMVRTCLRCLSSVLFNLSVSSSFMSNAPTDEGVTNMLSRIASALDQDRS